MANIMLGPFALRSPIARGGMGEVWRAVHVGQGVPVAVKVLTAEHGRHPDYAEQLRDEVRAVAALNHPGIAMVLDYGTVGRAAAQATGDRLVDGSPWFAMELASGGTLSGLAPPTWPTLKATLLAVLDALAHAHARGVVHRDLKPSNILVATAADARPGLKLTDFGVAHAWRGDLDLTGSVEDRVLGTPMYMAPEQIRGEWRDYGPWTDLYALGGTIYKLLTGDALFPGRSQRAIVVAHLNEAPRPLLSPHPVPRGFARWVERLIEKEPAARFRRAADAAAALVELGEPEGPRRGPSARAPVADVQTPALGETWRLAVDGPDRRPSVLMDTVIAAAARVDADPVTPREAMPMARPPPVPERWARPVSHPPPAPLLGAGMALYGLRAVPLVGRERERDALWAALRAVADTGRARVVLLHGPAGTGKSRLAKWLCHRGHEVGAANVAKAAFTPRLAPGEGLRRLGAAYLKTFNLPRVEVAERVDAFVHSHGGGTDEARVLTELLCPATPDEMESGAYTVRLTRPSEYYAATRDAMYRLSKERPLIAWFDDVQWGLHGLGLALQILATQEEKPFPVLIVMTMRDEEVADRPDEGRRVGRLLEQTEVEALRVGPLPAGAHAELVRRLLRLDGALASRVEERTGGNPLFAVQLVGDWVRRGVLEVGSAGFVLGEGADPSLPDDLHALWSSRLDEVLGEFPDQARNYLEIAAVLGREVQWVEWKRACDDPEDRFGGRFPGDDSLRAQLVERLLEERLAVGERRAWTFVHGMLKESLERVAAEAGRARAHHAACAAMLTGRREPEVAERLGRHLVAAGRHEDAIEPLLAGVGLRLHAFGPQPALALLSSAERAVVDSGLPASDARWGKVMALRARVLLLLGDSARADQSARGALDAADRFGWGAVRRSALSVRADIYLAAGDLAEAARVFAQLRNEGGLAGLRARVGLARVARRSGDLVGASKLLQGAREAFDPARAPLDLAQCELQLARVHQARGEDRAARSAYGSALVRFEALGGGYGSARCHEGLASLCAAAEDIEAAEDHLARALSLHDVLGSERALGVVLAIARHRVARGQLDAAVAILDANRGRLAALPHARRVSAALALALVEAAVSERAAVCDRLLEQLAEPAPSVALGRLLTLAAAVLLRAGDRVRARALLRVAEGALREVGDVAAAADAAQLALDASEAPG